jgi:hypothetical protein
MTGSLQSVDGYMNIALESCTEHVNGVKKRSYGDAFIRGNNGMLFCLPSSVSSQRHHYTKNRPTTLPVPIIHVAARFAMPSIANTK